LQDNESMVEMAQEPQNGFFKAEVGQSGLGQGTLNGFQSPFPRVATKYNNDLISE